MDCSCFYHHYHYYKSHAWCDWSLEVVGFQAELTFGAFTYVKVCIFGNFLCACEKSQGWQFFVFIVKFAIFCKPGEFLNSLQFFAIFPLLYKIYENCEKSQGWWFFAIMFFVMLFIKLKARYGFYQELLILPILRKISRSMIFWPATFPFPLANFTILAATCKPGHVLLL